MVADSAAPPSREAGVSFCIITDGRRPALLRATLDSIRALELPRLEILVAGNPPVDLGDDVQVIAAPDLAAAGRLGAMRNLACRAARYDQLVVSDDDMHFHPEFAEVLGHRDPAVDVVCVRLLNPDGTRYWDWATHGGPRGHALLSYDETDDHVYVTGGLATMWARVHDLVPWDDTRGFYQGEDIDWSARVRAAGLRIAFDGRGRVTHQDARYTQNGTQLRFRQDLTLRERLAPGIEATGLFREDVGGMTGCKWMSAQAELFAPARSAEHQAIEFVATSVAAALGDDPFAVLLEANGKTLGVLTFAGTQSVPVRIVLPAHTPLVVRLTSEKGVPGTAVGRDDDRPVSILLHDAKLSPH